MIAIGACQRAASPTATTIIGGVSPTQVIKQGTPSATPSQAEKNATQTAIARLTEQAYPQPLNPTSTLMTEIPYPEPTQQVLAPTVVMASATPNPSPSPTNTQPPTIFPQATQTERVDLETPTSTHTPTLTPTSTATVYEEYPGPGYTPYIPPPGTEEYPGPEFTATSPPLTGTQASPTMTEYPGTGTQAPTRTPTPRSGSATAPGGGSPIASPTTSSGTGTPGPTPTELPPPMPLSPPPAGSSVTIWHSWSNAETIMLREVIRSFQRTYADVTFTMHFVPVDDMFDTFRQAGYYGGGPSLLLGPASWGPALFEESLISNLAPFVPKDYLADINPAALTSAEYRNSLISLPLSLHGSLMFRNTSVISTAPSSFEELISLADRATHGGVVGSYLELGSSFSAANIIGLGGKLLGEDGLPLFNGAFGLQWLDLLTDYDKAGAVTLNSNRDLQMFLRGRVGIIIDGSWNIQTLAQGIGVEKLAIDRWPTYNNGRLAGWVETDSVYLNANTSDADRFAALSFMGYLLDPEVQMRLAEVGHIPAVVTTQPRDKLIGQAMAAFITGVPAPIVDEELLNLYWRELDQAIRDVFISQMDAKTALNNAQERIIQEIKNPQATPQGEK